MSPRLEDCPRYERCNAPICPLDVNWRRSAHLSVERVCFWLCEWSKSGGEARVRALLPTDVAGAVEGAHEAITQASLPLPRGHGVIRRALAAAATSGSRLEAGKRLQRLRQVWAVAPISRAPGALVQLEVSA